jgi:hypothetical protein
MPRTDALLARGPRVAARASGTERPIIAACACSLAFLLSACDPSGEQEMASCHARAQRAYPEEPNPRSSRWDEYLKACMATEGYKFNAVSFNCGHGDAYEDAACYVR